MSVKRIAIVGAGPAGLAAVRAYREHGGSAAVTLIGKESLLPYRRPPLTKEFVRGELDGDELPIEPPEWFAHNEIELRLDCEATAIDLDGGAVEAGGVSLAADAIVLATGAEPLRPELPGFDDPRVQTVRERGDSELIAARARAGARVVVIGTGFIGCELAASLAWSGAEVTLLGQEQAPQQQRLGVEAAARLAGWLEQLGVILRMGVEVCAVREGRVVELDRGKPVEADSVLLGMGMRPRSELAVAAGLPVAEGAVPTDTQMRVNGRVLAAGDVAYAHNRRAGRRLRVEHWGDALGQGEVVGRVLAGEDAHWQDVPGFWSTIGRHTIKYAAWGDGYDSSRLDEHRGGAFTIWYWKDGELVGALTHERDEDYERAQELIGAGEGA